ncbi:putative DNA-binding domain-containing protein [Vibrio sp. TBV020]|uniref:HvfC/BufC family peptide modification chaperone n=1 Tax=Vibrio sp. TBV020 TaxID=3137398 RepID=UPI0038CD696F
MHNPPASLVHETESLTALIRSPFGLSSVCRYSQFIRNNVLSVLNNTFPMFCDALNGESLNQLVDDFVVVHYASEPEFHHIATEFVKYIQIRTSSILSDGCVTPDVVSLLEFEWSAFCVEIEDCDTRSICYDFHNILANLKLFKAQPNKTLKLLQVPFIVDQQSVTFLEDRRTPIYYALYRDEHGCVVTLQLREVDVAVIQLLASPSVISLASLEQQVTKQILDFNLIDWIEHFLNINLISVDLVGSK